MSSQVLPQVEYNRRRISVRKEINKPSETIYSVACDPLADIYHILETHSNQLTTTGLPILVSGLTKEEAYDFVFSSWEEDSEGNLTYTKREFKWSTNYKELDAEKTCDDVNQIFNNLIISPIKHPDRNEYTIPYNEYVFNKAKTGDIKNSLYIKHLEKINNNESKDMSTLKNDGW